MKLLSVASARPNFVKLAAIDHACRLPEFSDVEHVIVHTGQHYDPLFSDVFFDELDIHMPAVNLGVHGGDRNETINRTEEALLPVLKDFQSDVVLVYGDVNGATGAGRACAKLGIHLAHVEAGLRSYDNTMPEELNRIEVDRLAQNLFCTEESGMQHLREEGVKGKAHLVGNTMIDTLIRMLPRIEASELPGSFEMPFGIVTLHRPSNVDDPVMLKKNLEFLSEVSERCPLVLPVHHRLRGMLDQTRLENTLPHTLRLIPAQPYMSFLRLVMASSFILTDSGGIQEEAVLLRKRCFTLRRNTERPVTIECGSNLLIDPSLSDDRQEVLAFAGNPHAPNIRTPEFWDGKAGERIVRLLRKA